MNDTPAETEAETLASVVRELATLAPEVFVGGLDSLFLYVEPNLRGPFREEDLSVYAPFIQSACQQICDARGWYWSLSSDLDDDDNLEYDGQVWWDEGMLGRYPYRAFRASPELAISSALRDALNAQQPSENTKETA